MGLFNPILGDIPQPKPNTKEVAFKELPQSNYSANVVTPLVNTLFCETLETTDTQTDTHYTTKEIILTQIIVQGLMDNGGDLVNGSVDIYINGVLILSLNVGGGIVSTPLMINPINIPLEHVLIPKNSSLKMVSTNTEAATSNLYMNCSFIGYEYTKL